MSIYQQSRTQHQHYNKWFMQKVRTFLKANKPMEISNKKYLAKHCFCLTMTFSRTRIGLRQNRQEDTIFPLGSIQMENFHILYSRFCQHMFGQNFRRKSKPKILAIACLDADGTKHGSCTAQDGFENIHLHAIVILPPGTSYRFLHYFDMRSNHVLDSDVLDCDEIHVAPLTTLKGKTIKSAMKNLISYTTKFMRFNCTSSQVAEEFRIYPEALRTHADNYNGRPKMQNMKWRKRVPLNMARIKKFGL